jgi:Fungal specific transcription factor domain
MDPSFSDQGDLQTAMNQPGVIEGLDFTDLSPGQMTAWPWLHEDFFLQQDWTGFEPGFVDASIMGSTEMTVNFSNVGHDTGHMAASRNGQYTSAVDMMPAGGMRPHDGITPPQNVHTVHLINQPEVIRDRPRSDLQQQGNHAPISLQSSGAANAQQNGNRIANVQMTVVSELIAYARQASLEPSRGGHVTYWYSMSMRVREAFNMHSAESPNASVIHCLDHLVHLYWENFWALWPMISAYAFDTHSISPVLYLAISSIGAMYGGSKASHFGVLLHEALRELLCEPMLTSDESDSSSLALAQARLLTQVAALYFGQKRAFSYAQHLGSVLIAQTRRMDLYSPSRHQHELAHVPTSTHESAENSKWLARWLLAESRKRLAFGILRAEVYTSVLLNARPMLCAEEVEIELPSSNYLWLTKFTSDAQFIAAIRQDVTSNMSEKLPFSDVVRITYERNEITPPLSVVSQELLIFGLQEYVWRLCHDPHTLSRLTGSQIDSKEIYNGLDDSPYRHERSPSLHSHPPSHNRSLSMISLESRLARRSRQMTSLRAEHKNTSSALYNWRQLLSTRNGELTRSDRTSLMSGLLLFHISFLRIFAPIEHLHHISYRVGSETGPGPEGDVVRAVWTWSQSDHARIAAQHACVVWSLLYQECSRAEETRARFNFLALLGLHHAAVVVWAFAGTHHDDGTEGESPVLAFDGAGEAETKMPVVSEMSMDLLTMFARLYGYISPAWSVRNSFSAAAVRLANNEFPLRPD